jgi:hypothetical protein
VDLSDVRAIHRGLTHCSGVSLLPDLEIIVMGSGETTLSKSLPALV